MSNFLPVDVSFCSIILLSFVNVLDINQCNKGFLFITSSARDYLGFGLGLYAIPEIIKDVKDQAE